ncbi:MAG: TonB-dependent receptor [Bacteroidales bacterium]|nr:TonB-dependent receptor [Bacteroidales bacterium]
MNEILITLRDDYKVMLSFDDKHLSTYKLTLNRRFSSPEQAFDFLIRGLPLAYEINEGVTVFYTVQPPEQRKEYVIAGKISDAVSHETLPFSAILINRSGLISDAKGNFAYTSTTDSVFSVIISYLGYYILDTIVGYGSHHNFRLTPSVIALEEIVVIGSEISHSIQTGISPGISKLNHKVAYYLPGNGDNSIFNLLRLQPGILAAGEQSADLIIRGSYEGQSQIIFDGFTIYGMKNFNDNISAVNPYMAKDIKVMKGSYGAEYGERVGSIVDITGMDGNRLSPSVQFSINNMTLNGKASVPFRKQSSLLIAYRQTFYNLYSPYKSTTSGGGFGRGWQSNGGADYYVNPDYGFRDMNLKYSGSGRKSNYFISLYGGMDHFSYTFEYEAGRLNTTLNPGEENLQLGGTAFYGFNWKKKNTSNIILSYSSLHSDREKTEETERTSGHTLYSSSSQQNNVSITELNSRTDNRLVFSEQHTADIGLGLLYYYSMTSEHVDQNITNNENTNLKIPYLYLQDNITLLKKITLKPGIRADIYLPQRGVEDPVAVPSKKIFFQPRLSARYRIDNHFSVNAAAGVYNQFVAKNMTNDTAGNYTMDWSLCDGNTVKVLNSQSYTLGCSYNNHGFTASLEGYIRNTGGITRYLKTGDITTPYEGDGKTKGLDVFIKQEFKNQTLWISYTLSKTEEYFTYFPSDEYLPAMHDQRHELKLAGLARIRFFHFSANYVFGSGVPDPGKLPDVIDYTRLYNRLDVAAIFKFTRRKLHIDAGISVMNVFNTENIRYSNYIRIPAEDTETISLYTGAVPRTPAVFLNIYY